MNRPVLPTLISKSEARRTVIKRLSNLDAVDIQNKTKLIIERLASTDDFFRSKRIHTYISTRAGEVDTRQLINIMEGAGKSIFVPKLNRNSKKLQRANFLGWDRLTKNSEGYYEPPVAFDDDLSDVDLVITPAVAVSLTGQRVGYGGGYYDRLLKHTCATKTVLAFEFQIFNNIETDVHDIRIDKIITERRVIDTRASLK